MRRSWREVGLIAPGATTFTAIPRELLYTREEWEALKNGGDPKCEAPLDR